MRWRTQQLEPPTYVSCSLYFVGIDGDKLLAGTDSNGFPIAPYLNLAQKDDDYTKLDQSITQHSGCIDKMQTSNHNFQS